MFPHIGTDNPNWLSYFSERLKPPTSIYIWMLRSSLHWGGSNGAKSSNDLLKPPDMGTPGVPPVNYQIPYLMTFGPVYQLLCQDSLWREHQQQHLLPEALHFANQRFSVGLKWPGPMGQLGCRVGNHVHRFVEKWPYQCVWLCRFVTAGKVSM